MASKLGKHSQQLPSDTSIPDKINYFYARFKASKTESCMRAAVPDDSVITLSAADVSKTFKQVAGPDGLPGRVFQASADQLASVFTDIFNLSLSESAIPTCFKQTTIEPVPKVTCLHDYRPVAHTSVAMKCFERLHTNLSHLDKRNTYVRMLFIDYSSAFNIIAPSKLITKLRTLGLNTSL
jgi:hypothetical protein